MPPEQTIRIIRAQDLILRGALSPPRDISGWAVTFQVRDQLAGSSVLSKTVGAGITLADTGKGILDIALEKADTDSLTVSSLLAAGKGYVWEITRTNAGQQAVLARGQLILEQEVVS